MAFMVKRGYRFAQPSRTESKSTSAVRPDGRLLHGLHSLQVAMEATDREVSQKIAKLDRETDELMRSSTWDPTADTVAMLTAKLPEGFLDYAAAPGQERGGTRPIPQGSAAAPAEAPTTPKWTEFEVGDRVSNKGFQIWWRGRVVELVGPDTGSRCFM